MDTKTMLEQASGIRYEALLDLVVRISRSACLDQRLNGECICFSCKAQRLVTQAEKGE